MDLSLLRVSIRFFKNKKVIPARYMIHGLTHQRTLTTLCTRHTLRQDYVLIEPYPQSPLRIHSNNPILLLYGWLNAGDRPFGKYIDLYQHLGYYILAHIPPLSIFMLPKRQPDYVHNMFRNLMLALSDLSSLNDQPIDVHVLSNNGFYQFAALYQTLRFQSIETASRCRKIVVDSAPSHLDLSIFVRGFSLALSVGNSTLDSLLSTLLRVYFSSLGIRSASSDDQSQHPLISGFHRMIRDHPPQCPHLFLYSDTDSLVPKHDVESYANHLRKHGIDVAEHMFHGSEHVSHYRSFPQEYIELISKFLK